VMEAHQFLPKVLPREAAVRSRRRLDWTA